MPITCSVGERLLFITDTGASEFPVPKSPVVVHYGGDNEGAIVNLKTPDGEHLTSFALQKPGSEQIVRFEHTANLPIEKGRSPEVRVQRTLNFKRI